MKTIRQSQFEVNSSSTHSFSANIVNLNNKLDVTFVPDENNEIHIPIESGANASNATPQDKSAFLLLYAKELCNQSLFDQIINIIELFTKAKVVASYSSYDYALKKNITVSPFFIVGSSLVSEDEDEDACLDSLGDTFYNFVGDLGHGSNSDFKKDIDRIVRSDETIRTFIFSSNQGYYIEIGYDG